MPQLDFVPADRFSLDQLSRLLTRAYTGYAVPIDVDAIGLEAMIAAYDIDLAGSRVGVRGGEPVAIALLGVRERRGWIGGGGGGAGRGGGGGRPGGGRGGRAGRPVTRGGGGGGGGDAATIAGASVLEK